MIRVRPARNRRVEFAQYVTRRSRAARMLTEADLAIPDRIYTTMPERLLVGALVEGHPYEPVTDEPQTSTAPPTDPDDPPHADYGYAHGNLDAPTNNPASQPTQAPEPPKNGVDCPICGRHMLNERGLKTHIGRAHPSDNDEDSA